MISGYGTIEAGVSAAKAGANDFIEKPFTSKRLFEAIDNIFSVPEIDISLSDDGVNRKYGLNYRSSKIQKIVNTIEKLASNNMNVLITGESGTGKEIVARAIHNQSNRKNSPFVHVNCGALPESLFESELFGHEKGAFTGAIKKKPGLFEFADGGTFLLDEIGEMSMGLQAKLLRMLEERKIRRVGGQKEFEIDVRIIAATNKKLEELIEEKQFRNDLYYRLNTINIEIPPLRDRREDILPLAEHFLRVLTKESGEELKEYSAETKDILEEYDWPGNVRELQNIVDRAFYLSNSRVIQPDDIPVSKSKESFYFDDNMFSLSFKDAKKAILEKFEVSYLTYHLKRNEGNISRTANECGIDRRTIHRLIQEYNIIYKD